VHRLNETVTEQIDCTQCGACCKMLMINVEPAEAESVSAHLGISTTEFKEKYIEESLQGQMIMSSIPCHFLKDKTCTVYPNRFSECREFPHLDRKNFKDRLFGTLIHYAICPIIFNVVEELKIETGFKKA
jgi:Fe-S-cluster containining protein